MLVLLADEAVPNSVIEFLRERGHTVHLVRERFPPRTADPVISRLGEETGSIVVTWNHRDFSELASGQRGLPARFPNMSLITFKKVPEANGRQRLGTVIDTVEFECARAQRMGERVRIEIREKSFKVLR